MQDDIHISEFVKTRTQHEVAVIMGLTQGAVHQMLKSERDIYFKDLGNGRFECYEVKKINPAISVA